MAPIAAVASRYDPSQFNKNHTAYTAQGNLTVSRENSEKANYPEFLPTWNPNAKYPPLKFQSLDDKGVYGDDGYSSLLEHAGNGEYTMKNVTPKFGTEIEGIQLSELDENAKNDLSLLLARRGVVIFRNQNLLQNGPKYFADWSRYFGPLHIHPTSGAPENVPDLHVTFRGTSKDELESAFKTRLTNTQWHTDVSYEKMPPSYCFFSVLQGPESGGDTLFADTVEAYKRLSPEFQKRLQGLHVLHTSEDQAHLQRQQGGFSRRDPVSNIHPLIVEHPVTKEKYIFLNREFSRQIVELKEEESTFLMEFLYNHIESAHDLQLRASWEPNTVVCWDNRRTVHSPTGIDESATDEFGNPVIRFAVRSSPQGPSPVADLQHFNDPHYLGELYLKLGIIPKHL